MVRPDEIPELDSTAQAPAAPPRVLVVMDDLFFRKLFRRHLEEAGYAVSEALSVERALDRLGREVPEIILLDTWIERGAGLRLLEELRRRGYDETPVLLVGREARAHVRQRAQELGALGPMPVTCSVDVEEWVEEALLSAL